MAKNREDAFIILKDENNELTAIYQSYKSCGLITRGLPPAETIVNPHSNRPYDQTVSEKDLWQWATHYVNDKAMHGITRRKTVIISNKILNLELYDRYVKNPEKLPEHTLIVFHQNFSEYLGLFKSSYLWQPSVGSFIDQTL